MESSALDLLSWLSISMRSFCNACGFSDIVERKSCRSFIIFRIPDLILSGSQCSLRNFITMLIRGIGRRSTYFLLLNGPAIASRFLYASTRRRATSSPVGQEMAVETNIKSETNRLEKTLLRFWEKVNAKYDGAADAYEIQLDGKTLRTPLGYKLVIPAAKKQLAHLISHEWTNVPDLKVKPGSLPLTSLACRAIDLQETHSLDEDAVAQVGRLEDIRLNLLKYLDTDTCLIFTTLDEYEGKLRARQDELYLPLIKEYEHFFTEYGRKNKLLTDDMLVQLSYLDCETDGLRGNEQSITTQNVVLHWLDQLPIYDLVALEKAIYTSKSFLCGASVLRSSCTLPTTMQQLYQANAAGEEQYFHKTMEQIVELGNLETIFQTEQWGEVEDTHDVDKVEWLRSLTSAALIVH